MLVLTRRPGEGDHSVIIIGDPSDPARCVEVTLTDVRGDQVRLGVTAPPDVAVHRREIYDDIQARGPRT